MRAAGILGLLLLSLSGRTCVSSSYEAIALQENVEFIMANPTLDDDVEFEVENIKNANELKEGEMHMPHLFHMRLQLLQGKVNAASNQGRLLYTF